MLIRVAVRSRYERNISRPQGGIVKREPGWFAASIKM